MLCSKVFLGAEDGGASGFWSFGLFVVVVFGLDIAPGSGVWVWSEDCGLGCRNS